MGTGSVSASGIIACIMGTWLAQPAWAQCLHTRVLTCTACAATARLCTIGPIRAAGRFFAQRVLAEDVFSRRSLGAQLAVGRHCAPAVQQLRSSIAPRVVPAKGSVSPTLSISLLVGAMLWWLVGHWTRVRHGHRPAWSQAILVTAGLVGHGLRSYIRYHHLRHRQPVGKARLGSAFIQGSLSALFRISLRSLLWPLPLNVVSSPCISVLVQVLLGACAAGSWLTQRVS